jgi:hypothetical protein
MSDAGGILSVLGAGDSKLSHFVNERRAFYSKSRRCTLKASDYPIGVP